jgi:quinol monooxygenase YgiN
MLLIAGEFRVSPEKRAAFADLARELGAASRVEEGCRFFEFWADLDGSGRFLVFEGWEREEHLFAHRETPHFAAFREANAALGPDAVEITRYRATEIEI